MGVPVLVMRYETERKENIKIGFSKLVGANINKIVKQSSLILSKNREDSHKNSHKSPYGMGNSSQKIKKIIDTYFSNK